MSKALQYREVVKIHLAQIAKEHGIVFIHVADAGSRSWGSSTEDSDIDLKCIHVKLPWARNVEESTDTLRSTQTIRILGTAGDDVPVSIDLQSFELRKALQLLTRSDPVFYDMVYSPGVMAQSEMMHSCVYPMVEAYQNRSLMARRYAEMAFNNLWPERSSRDPEVRDNPPTKRALMLALRFTMLCEAVMQDKSYKVRDYQGLIDLDLAAGYKRMWPEVMDYNDVEVHHHTAIMRDFLDFLTRRQKEFPLPGERNRDMHLCQRAYSAITKHVVLNYTESHLDWK